MLSSTDLPADAAFAAGADYVQDDYQVSCGTGTFFGKSESPNSTVRRASHLTSIGGTPAGSNVPVESSVALPNGGTANVSLVFDQVDTAGLTSVSAGDIGPPSPYGFKLMNPPVFYDVHTTATFSGSVRVCLGWTEGQLANESQARVFHLENDSWVEHHRCCHSRYGEQQGVRHGIQPVTLHADGSEVSVRRLLRAGRQPDDECR